MTNAKRDANSVTIPEGVLNTDGVTPKMLESTPSDHILHVLDGTTGTDFGNDAAARDDNARPTLIASDATGAIIPLYVDSNGNLLIKTT